MPIRHPMSESAIHLVDEVLPIKLRVLLAVRSKIMSEILNIATSAIAKHVAKKAGFKPAQCKSGSITLIQRFGGSINLNVHFHQLFLDGVYEVDTEGRPNEFHITKAPAHMELGQVLDTIIKRTTRHLEKRGIIRRDEDSLQIDLSEDDALTRLQAGAAT